MWSPQDSNLWWLDRLLVKLGILCYSCGKFQWDCTYSKGIWRICARSLKTLSLNSKA